MPRILAVIVTYNPEQQIIESVARLLAQVDEVVVVDNGSNQNSRIFLDNLDNLNGLTLIYNDDNLGLAAALNIGVRYSLRSEPEWVFTFDQDSLVTPGFTEKMLEAYRACSYRDQVALIAPVYQDQTIGTITSTSLRRKPFDSHFPYDNVIQTRTSGMLIKATTFGQVGLFREDFFIDCVDGEFCFRCLKAGFKLIEASGAILLHNLGSPSEVNFLGKKTIITNHNAVRRYYMARNKMVIYRAYFLSYPRWAIGDIRYFTVQLLKIIFFEKDRWRKIEYSLRGIYHGIIGVTGEYRPRSG